MCAIRKPLLKVLLLVDGDKPAMSYFFDAVDRANESIHCFCALFKRTHPRVKGVPPHSHAPRTRRCLAK